MKSRVGASYNAGEHEGRDGRNKECGWKREGKEGRVVAVRREMIKS